MRIASTAYTSIDERTLLPIMSEEGTNAPPSTPPTPPSTPRPQSPATSDTEDDEMSSMEAVSGESEKFDVG